MTPYEILSIKIKNSPSALKEITQTQEICEYAFNQNPNCFRFINNEFKTQVMCNIAVTYSYNNVQYVPYNMQSTEMVTPILESIPINYNVPYVNPDFITMEHVLKYVDNKQTHILEYIPESFQTAALCKSIIDYDGAQINHVKKDFVTNELLILSFKTHKPLYNDFNKYSKDIQIKLIKMNWSYIQYIDNPTNAMCVMAIKKNPDAIHLIKNPTDEQYSLAIRLDWKVIYRLNAGLLKEHHLNKALKYAPKDGHEYIEKLRAYMRSN
jgi:hypothetical protein